MENIKKNKEIQKPINPTNENKKYNDRIVSIIKKEKLNFVKTSKNNYNLLKNLNKMITEFCIQKKQKYNSIKNKPIIPKRYYIYDILYNNIFLILNLYILFLYISLSKQNSDLNYLSSMQAIKLTINGPAEKPIFGNNFKNKPDAIYINEKEVNLTEKLDDNIFVFEEKENIVKLYFSNPPDSFENMFSYNIILKKVDFTNFDTSKVKTMNNMFGNCLELEYVIMNGIDTSSVLNMGFMFQNCPKLLSLDLSSFNTSSVIDMNCMFCSCKSLTSLNISNFNTSLVTTMTYMFSGCESLESLDLSSFKTDKHPDMNNMFFYCKNLKSIKFPTKNKITGSNMGYLFQECSSLISLDLSSFDTSFTYNLNNMFEKCTSLISVNLSNFNTSQVIYMENMFKECTNLEFLDLKSFDTKSIFSMESMFRGCSSLKYLDIRSFIIKNKTNIKNIFLDSNDNLTLCCENEYSSILSKEFTFINNCSDICFSDTKKIITELSKCVEDCNIDTSEYKYEYNKRCYIECPEGTTSSPDNQFLCIKTDCEYYNIDKTECFEDFPEGYYIYNNKEKIIDKCHENCKTCNKKEDENNNNCITCKNGFFFEDGNCVVSCKHNSYIDDNGNKICTCSSNIKCKECSEESLKKGLCISCNIEGGFYPINYDTLNNSFINCYDDITGYYLEDNVLYSCSLMCFSCSKGGDLNDHNCDECKSDYTFLNGEGKKGNCYKKCENYYYFDEFNKYKCTNRKTCPDSRRKLITEKGKCIDECYNDDTYKYEYNNECYKKCPDNQICKYKIDEDIITQVILDNTENIKNTEELTIQITQNIGINTTEITLINMPTASETHKNTEELNFETIQNTEIKTSERTQINITTISETQKITEKFTYEVIQNIENQTMNATQNNITIFDSQNIEINWNSSNFFFGLIDKKEINISKDDIINNIKEDIINHKIDNLLSNITKGNKEDLYIKNEDVLYQITTTDNQNNKTYNNISTIKLGECENILKSIYNIDRNLSLIILKIDYYLEGLLIPIIGYEVYHPIKKTKLNLSYCNETLISYNIPVSIDENNLFKYDQNSEYYNDECSTYTTEDGTDILINDRKEEFIQNNMSLCENICTYTGYDKNNKKALCECGIKYQEFILSDIEKQTDLLSNNLTTEDSSNSNLGTMKCYETLFSKEGLLTNIGNYILLFIIFVHMISIVLFYKCGYYILENKMKKIISKIRKRSRLSNTKIKKNEVYDTKLTKTRNKKKKKSSIYINPNPSKKVKKIIRNRKLTQEKTDKNYKLKLNDNHINNISEKEHSQSIIYLRKLSSKSVKLKSKTKNKEDINNYNDFELNSLKYKVALEIDKRTYSQYYISLLKTKHPIIFSFCPIRDDNSFIIKICLFCLSFSIYYFFVTLFFNYKAIHEVYEQKGNYNISYFMSQIIYSFIISYIINAIIKFIFLSERNILELKNEKINRKLFDKQTKVQRCLIVKYIFYFIISFVFLIFFWYYLSSFCAVYQNSQVYVIKNTFISFIIGLIYPFFINLFPGIFRLYSLNNKRNKRECIYKFSQFLQLF